MLEKVDLSQSIDKSEYQERIQSLRLSIGELQRKIHELSIPVTLVFEGWGAAGKGTLINSLILSMDPRGFNVHSTQPPTEEEIMRPFLWRFWTKTPDRGRIAIFDRSWYGRVLTERVEGIVKNNALPAAFEAINAFERQLTDDGAVILKFFLHISKKEQKKRFEKLEANAFTSWRVTKEDWRHHRQYGLYVAAIEEMLEKTGTAHAPWTIVEARDQRFATIKCFSVVVETLQRAVDDALQARKSSGPAKRTSRNLLKKINGSVLDKADLSLEISESAYEKKMARCQEKIWELEHEAYRKRLPVLIMFEGWDAAGKGGAIKRLAQGMDPRGYEVVPFAAPNDIEKRHQYLWRFWTKFPKAGHIAIFDRSWYGRLLVERVEGFCREDEWQRAYTEINETEAQCADFGMVILKFWLHIDKNEQLKRFKAREGDPNRRWKITEEDWRNRKKWNAYKQAIDEMIIRTDTPHAPWTIVEATSKLYARIKVLDTVIQAMERRL
jgi:polyphosphate:AMP phosphotransferase